MRRSEIDWRLNAGNLETFYASNLRRHNKTLFMSIDDEFRSVPVNNKFNVHVEILRGKKPKPIMTSIKNYSTDNRPIFFFVQFSLARRKINHKYEDYVLNSTHKKHYQSTREYKFKSARSCQGCGFVRLTCHKLLWKFSFSNCWL